jgi:hypothetical protein
MLKIWGIRGVLVLVLIAAYAFARKQWHVEREPV